MSLICFNKWNLNSKKENQIVADCKNLLITFVTSVYGHFIFDTNAIYNKKLLYCTYMKYLRMRREISVYIYIYIYVYKKLIQLHLLFCSFFSKVVYFLITDHSKQVSRSAFCFCFLLPCLPVSYFSLKAWDRCAVDRRSVILQ